ncbi:MAG: D-aminoacylase [Bacillota bacterium]|nr:D-aminoacylase [Bacillota bacterium]
MSDFSVVFRGGWVVDGSGGPRYLGTVAVKDDRIAVVSSGSPDLTAERTVDCTGLAIAPGFVDPHSHTDGSIVDNPHNENSIRNGITTEATGNCGSSAAPGAASVSDWFSSLEQMKIGNNLALFAGQGTIRQLAMGGETRGYPTVDELARQKEILEAAMQDGCIGISSGRAYIPGCFASTWECAELGRVVAKYDGIYTFHIQNQNEYVAEATREVIQIGKRADLPVLIAHQKIMGKSNWGRAGEMVDMMERARGCGIEVMSDVYPYNFSAVIHLGDRIVPRTADVDPAEAARRLHEPAAAGQLYKYLASLPQAGGFLPYFHNLLPQYGIVWCAKTKEYEGLDVREAALQMGYDLYQAVINLLRDNDLGVKLAGIMSEDDVRTFLKWPHAMVGTDSSARDPAKDRVSAKISGVHPRCYGTHSRVLGHYVRETGLLSLEEAVKKMTSMPADYLGLADRGRLRPNLAADVVVFDPARVSDRATIEDPAALPVGIPYVMVNGRLAVDGGERTAVQAGRALRDLQGRYPYQ